ncbi:hypothetical protein [Sphingobium sp.]|uniref:hypothetical protein n=1 Tax=Sphingobium sp. TaxID=1912891 RepID=UPI0028BD26BC|nr:hypothetical protein [Sphingobium sp.]
MSNYASIDRTIFQTINADGLVTETSYGFRIYDDHGACYDNYVETLEDLKALSHEELIERARNLNDQSADMIEFAQANDLPVLVDGISVYLQPTNTSGSST